MNTETYLQRINYEGPVAPNLEMLRLLHRAHMLSVPFENLDIHLGRPIILDQDALYAKIVTNRRGGFCYELNGLFCGLLREIGYRVSMLSGGVARADGSFDPDFDHMTLLVSLEEPWLADVGFGDSFIEPIRLGDSVSEDVTGSYRVQSEAGSRVLLKLVGEGEWKAQYRFTLQPREIWQYREMCIFQQTSPESHFTKGRICSKATESGRITLTELKLIETTYGGSRKVSELGDESEVQRALADYFQVVL